VRRRGWSFSGARGAPANRTSPTTTAPRAAHLVSAGGRVGACLFRRSFLVATLRPRPPADTSARYDWRNASALRLPGLAAVLAALRERRAVGLAALADRERERGGASCPTTPPTPACRRTATSRPSRSTRPPSSPTRPRTRLTPPPSPASLGGLAAPGRVGIPLTAAVDAELSKRRRVVAVRLSEVEHLVWRREAAADKRGQLGAWTRSVVGAEIARRHGADVPDSDAENAGGGAVVVLNESVVRELNQQLVRVGNLLNQVTRLAHTEARTGGVAASTMAQVVSGIDQTRATIAALDGRLEEMSQR